MPMKLILCPQTHTARTAVMTQPSRPMGSTPDMTKMATRTLLWNHEPATARPGPAVMTQPSTLAMVGFVWHHTRVSLLFPGFSKMCFPPLLYMPVPERAAFLSLPLCSSLPMPKGAVSDGSTQRMYAAIRTPKRGHLLLPLSPLLSSPKIFSLPLTEVQLLGRENFVFAAALHRESSPPVLSCPLP
ncbi:hypothetical protein F5148DRAFT_1369044 [Russula earlei]|uniref:Uncharacterized protein n=1 Tax=Russula earlei TaxID=71964 RepID=A0ACC0U4E8_9AGAM|nr:hypothetical protein F5148DRAFT_1369044 [Russula earlei]